MPVLLDDSFDAYALGALNGQFGWSEASGDDQVVADPYRAGRCVKVQSPAGATLASKALFGQDLAAATGSWVQFDFAIPTNAAGRGVKVSIRDGSNVEVFAIAARNDPGTPANSQMAWDGSTFEDWPFTFDAWHTLRVVVDVEAATARGYLDGAVVKQNIAITPGTFWRYVGVANAVDPENQPVYVDEISFNLVTPSRTLLMERCAQPFWVVEIELDAAPRRYSDTSRIVFKADGTLEGIYDGRVNSFGTISESMTLLTGDVDTSSVGVRIANWRRQLQGDTAFGDGLENPALDALPQTLLNRPVSIKLGYDGLDPALWKLAFSGQVRRVTLTDDGLTLNCEDPVRANFAERVLSMPSITETQFGTASTAPGDLPIGSLGKLAPIIYGELSEPGIGALELIPLAVPNGVDATYYLVRQGAFDLEVAYSPLGIPRYGVIDVYRERAGVLTTLDYGTEWSADLVTNPSFPIQRYIRVRIIAGVPNAAVDGDKFFADVYGPATDITGVALLENPSDVLRSLLDNYGG